MTYLDLNARINSWLFDPIGSWATRFANSSKTNWNINCRSGLITVPCSRCPCQVLDNCNICGRIEFLLAWIKKRKVRSKFNWFNWSSYLKINLASITSRDPSSAEPEPNEREGLLGPGCERRWSNELSSSLGRDLLKCFPQTSIRSSKDWSSAFIRSICQTLNQAPMTPILGQSMLKFNQ